MSETIHLSDRPLVIVQLPGRLIPEDSGVNPELGNEFDDPRLSNPEFSRHLLVGALGRLGCKVAIVRGADSYKKNGLSCGLVKNTDEPSGMVIAEIDPSDIGVIYNETSKGLSLPRAYENIPQLNDDKVMDYVRGNYKQNLPAHDIKVWPKGQIFTDIDKDISELNGRTVVRAYIFGSPDSEENTRLLIANQIGSKEFQKNDDTSGKRPTWEYRGFSQQVSSKTTGIYEEIRSIYNEVKENSDTRSTEFALQINFYPDETGAVVPISVRASEIMPPYNPQLAREVQELRARQLCRLANRSTGTN